jgi:hypothetical protein
MVAAPATWSLADGTATSLPAHLHDLPIFDQHRDGALATGHGAQALAG